MSARMTHSTCAESPVMTLTTRRPYLWTPRNPRRSHPRFGRSGNDRRANGQIYRWIRLNGRLQHPGFSPPKPPTVPGCFEIIAKNQLPQPSSHSRGRKSLLRHLACTARSCNGCWRHIMSRTECPTRHNSVSQRDYVRALIPENGRAWTSRKHDRQRASLKPLV